MQFGSLFINHKVLQNPVHKFPYYDEHHFYI